MHAAFALRIAIQLELPVININEEFITQKNNKPLQNQREVQMSATKLLVGLEKDRICTFHVVRARRDV